MNPSRKGQDSGWSLRAAPARELRVLVDRDTVHESAIVLDLLLKRGGIAALNYRDAGPPPDAELTSDDFYPPTAIGWVTVRQSSDEGTLTGRPVLTASRSVVSEHLLLTSSVDYLRIALKSAASVQFVEDDIVLFAIAEELSIDLLITGREGLLDSPLATGSLQVRGPSSSVPAVALYLRGTDEMPAAVSPNLTEVVRPASRYFSSAVEEYVPSGRAVQVHLESGGSAPELILVEAVQRKLASALMRRDMVWRLALQHPTFAQLDEMAAEVDAFLLLLTSALDAQARFLDSALSLNTERNKIGFQQKTWRTALTTTLGQGFGFSEVDLNIVSAMTGLRNFTHGAGARTLPIDVGAHQWKKTTAYTMYEYQGSSPAWKDPLDALNALRDSAFASRAFDIWRQRDAPEVFITPGPMCDLLAAGTLALVESVFQVFVQDRGIGGTTKQPEGLRIYPHIRKQQTFEFLGLPGFGGVECLS